MEVVVTGFRGSIASGLVEPTCVHSEPENSLFDVDVYIPGLIEHVLGPRLLRSGIEAQLKREEEKRRRAKAGRPSRCRSWRKQ
jgi:hypothetical protein